MYDAMDAIIQYSMKEEERNFFENMEQEELEDKELFTNKMKSHILYRYIQMTCRGDAEKIQCMVEHYWDMWGEEEE